MDNIAAGNPAASPLLVRPAHLAGEREVAALLRDVPVNAVEVSDLLRRHWVLVLSDLTLPPAAPPVAVAAFRLDRPAGTAELAGIAVRLDVRRRGLGRRLLSGALTWLRAEGFERVQALAPPAGAGESLLASIGFAADYGTPGTDGRAQVVLLL